MGDKIDTPENELAANESSQRPKKKSPSGKKTQLLHFGADLIGQFGAPSKMVYKWPSPNYRGPLSMQRAQNLSTKLLLKPFEYKPKMVISIDVGERRVGVGVAWQKSPSHPLVPLFLDNINLFPNHPLDLDYLDRLYKIPKLATEYARWDEANTIEDVISADIADYERAKNYMATFVPEAAPAPMAGLGSEAVKRSRKTFRAKRALLEQFFDTTQEKSYMENGTMNPATFKHIPKCVEDIFDTLDQSMSVYAQYFRQCFGKVDYIFIEEQNLRFGEQGKRDQLAIKTGLTRHFPETETEYRVLSASIKMSVYGLLDTDIVTLNKDNVWKTKHFFAMGPTSSMVYNSKAVPKPKRGVLEQYSFEEVKPTNSVTNSNPPPIISAATSSAVSAERTATNTKKRHRDQIMPAKRSSSIDDSMRLLNGNDEQEDDLFCFDKNDEPEPKRHCPDESISDTVFGQVIDLSCSSSDEQDEENVLSPMPFPFSRQLSPTAKNVSQPFSVNHILSKFRVLEPK